MKKPSWVPVRREYARTSGSADDLLLQVGEHGVGVGERGPRRRPVVEDDGALVHGREKVGAEPAIEEDRRAEQPDADEGRDPRLANEKRWTVVQTLVAADGLRPRAAAPEGAQAGGEAERGEEERDRQRDRHREGERLKEGARHARQQGEGKKDHDRRDARADQRRENRLQARHDGLLRSRVAVVRDALDDDDGVVGDQAERRGDSAEGHQVDRLAGDPEQQQHDGDGQRDGGDREQRQAPVAEEDQENQRGERHPDENRVADAEDRPGHELRLVVEARPADVLRQQVGARREELPDSSGDRDGVRRRLSRQVDQHRRMPVRGGADVRDGLRRLSPGRDRRRARGRRRPGRGRRCSRSRPRRRRRRPRARGRARGSTRRVRRRGPGCSCGLRRSRRRPRGGARSGHPDRDGPETRAGGRPGSAPAPRRGSARARASTRTRRAPTDRPGSSSRRSGHSREWGRRRCSSGPRRCARRPEGPAGRGRPRPAGAEARSTCPCPIRSSPRSPSSPARSSTARSVFRARRGSPAREAG